MKAMPPRVVSVRIVFSDGTKDKVFERPIFTQVAGSYFRVAVGDKENIDKAKLYSFPAERIKEVVEELEKPPEQTVVRAEPRFVPPVSPN